MAPWEGKLLLYTQVDILRVAANSCLEGITVLLVTTLFVTAVGYNAIIVALLRQSEGFYSCSFLTVASVMVTMGGYTIYSYAETVECLSENFVKMMQTRAADQIRQHKTRRRIAQRSSSGGSIENCDNDGSKTGDYGHWSSYIARNFRRMPLRLEMRPFGRVQNGGSVTWVEQVVENTVNAIFMITLGDVRVFL